MLKRIIGRSTGVTRLAVLPYLLVGYGLVAQPQRFSRTPAYGNLINVFPAVTWGVLHLIVAAGLIAWCSGKVPVWFGNSAHTIAIVLVGGWWGSFVVRWITDASTTIVNPTSWTVFLILTAWSSVTVWDNEEGDDDTD